MWGNSRGWIIAVVIVGLQGLLVWKAIEFNQPTPVTALVSQKGILDPITLETDPATLVPMDKDGDGTSLYRAALAEVKAQSSRYQKYVDEGTSSSVVEFPAVQKLIDATALQPSPILATDLDANINYDFEPEECKALLLAGQAAEHLGVMNMANNPDIAKKCFNAEIALGAKMLAERVRYYEAFDGMSLLRGGVGGLKAVASRASDKDTVEKLSQFDESAGNTLDKLTNLWKVVGSIDTDQIALHSGDVYYFSGSAMKEKMWRIESILKLGRHKFNAGKMADAKYANTRLKYLVANEKDPALLAAAKAADDLAVTDFRMMQTGRQ